jgi:hypothetical protein
VAAGNHDASVFVCEDQCRDAPTLRPSRVRKNTLNVSFRGAARPERSEGSDEESLVLSASSAERFLAPFRMTREEAFFRKLLEARKVVQCGSHAERGSAQNRNAGKDRGAVTSVETLISRQRSASAARVASAWPAY